MSKSRFIMQMLREQHEIRMRAMRDIIPGPSRIVMHAIKEFAALHCGSQSQGDKHKRDIFKDCFRTILATTMQTKLYRQLERATTVEVSLHRPLSDSSRAEKATIAHSFPRVSSDVAPRSRNLQKKRHSVDYDLDCASLDTILEAPTKLSSSMVSSQSRFLNSIPSSL